MSVNNSGTQKNPATQLNENKTVYSVVFRVFDTIVFNAIGRNMLCKWSEWVRVMDIVHQLLFHIYEINNQWTTEFLDPFFIVG